MIHPAETFPLVLSIGIVIQGLVFAALQGEGLHSLFTFGCGTIAQFMWIGMFYLGPQTFLILMMFSSFHCSIYSTRVRTRMCYKIFEENAFSTKRKIRCFDMLRDNCVDVGCHLDPNKSLSTEE